MHAIYALLRQRLAMERPIRDIVIASASLLLLFMAVDGWRVWKDRSNEIRDASVNLENMVRMIAEQTESTFEMADALLVANVRNMESAPADASVKLRMHEALVAVIEKSSRILVVSVFDDSGNWLVNSSRNPANTSQNFAERDYFRYHRAHADDKLLIGEPIKGKTTGKWAITLTRRWNKPDGGFGGVVLVGITLDYFQQFFATLNIGDNGAVALHRDDAIVLARRPYREENLGKSVAKGEIFSKYLPLSPSGTYRVRAVLDHQDRLASYRHLNKYPIVASAALSMDEVLAQWRQDTWRHLFGMLIIFGIFFALAYRLVRQIKQRAEAEQALRLSAETIQRAVSHQEEIEHRLRENEHFLASLLDFIPGMVAYWNADLHCRFANKSYQEWFGKSKEQMLGIRLPDLLGEVLFQKNAPYIQGALGGEAQHFERALTKANGEIGYTWAHYLPDVEKGKVLGFFVLVADVTELKLGQLKLEKLNEELNVRTLQAEAASVAKSQFLANMSHEIRTPMNAVLGMVQLLEQTELSARQHDYVAKAQSATHSLLAIINDILDFSKVEAGKMALDVGAFALDTPFSELSVILSASVGSKDIEVVFEIDPRIPPYVVGDALRLQQVLLNLAGNAIKFTERGEVVISATLAHLAANEVAVNFSVRDTGIGIGPDQLQFIFTGFSQAEASTSRRFGGTGLGLAISRRLVELMGGRLQVESEPGKGSRFFFSLQFKMETAQQAPAGETLQGKKDPQHQQRILLVDDNQTARNSLSSMLANCGWHVATASGGTQALQLLQAAQISDAPFDVLLIDGQMPDMDGWDTATQVRQQAYGASVPIILMVTTYSRAQLSERLHAAPATVNSFLFKPVTASMLLEAIANSGHTPGNASSSALPSSTLGTPRLGGLRLLVVEDNLLNQHVAKGLLSNEGAEVVVASSGQQGIDLLLKAQPAFDLVLMDIQMPDMDGYATTRAIRQLAGMQSLPILAMTANAMPADREASLAAGMNDHICKPINMTELVRAICKFVRPRNVASAAPVPAPPSNSEHGLSQQAQAFAAHNQIDLDGALARFGGHLPVYCGVLHVFESDALQMSAQIVALLAQGDTAALERLLHTLKSTSAAIGAHSVATTAGELEARLRSGVTPDAVTTELQALSQLLVAKSAAIKQLSALLTQATTQNAIAVDTIDREQLRSDLQTLMALMQASNLDALTRYADLQGVLSALAADINRELEAALERLDFATAIPYCQQLIQQLSNGR